MVSLLPTLFIPDDLTIFVVPSPIGEGLNVPGALDSTICSPCDIGTSSPVGGTICTVCAAGTSSIAGQGTCTACLAGQFSALAGKVCINCPA